MKPPASCCALWDRFVNYPNTPYKLSDVFTWHQGIQLKLIEHIRLLIWNKRRCEVFESGTLQTANDLYHTYDFIPPFVTLHLTRCLTPVEPNYAFVTFCCCSARLLQTQLFWQHFCLEHFVKCVAWKYFTQACQLQFSIAILRDIASYSHWSRADVTYLVSCEKADGPLPMRQ